MHTGLCVSCCASFSVCTTGPSDSRVSNDALISMAGSSVPSVIQGLWYCYYQGLKSG